MRILGIETSCDETAAAVVQDGQKMLSNSISTSLDLHKAYGGVVPEIAARSQLESILPTVDDALKTADSNWEDIDAIAVTVGPGLIGSLLIGVLTARTLAIVKQKPLFGVNHVMAHVYANFITSTTLANYRLSKDQPKFPCLALIVSGGHTQLVLFSKHDDYKLLGQTRDDAIGEAFDKVAKMLGLPYPGGPSVAMAAQTGDPLALKLPTTRLDNPYDFSFSGLKTAVLRASQHLVGQDFTLPSSALSELLNASQKTDIAASFQSTSVKELINRLKMAANEHQPRSIVIAGGVAANHELRQQLETASLPGPIFYPDLKLCTDNAAMVAACAYYTARHLTSVNPHKLEVFPNLSM